MSTQECPQPDCRTKPEAAVRHLIKPHEKDLGGFTVRRVLPSIDCRRVGPFIFWDHMGPATFAPGHGMDVRPHPHIGLSTLTYLFAGSIMHRDSLGYVQLVNPGEVNWMTAGRGIVHSERTPPDLRAKGFDIHGIQSWIALPDGQEEVAPAFTHHEAGDLPVIRKGGVTLTLVAGEAFGERSPVPTHSPLFYVHAEAEAGSTIPLPSGYEERAYYLVTGELDIAGERIGATRMMVIAPGVEVTAKATKPSCVMLIGGAPLASDRIVWWNFSSSSRERLEAAKADWLAGRLGQVPGETEFIPLPD